MIRLTLTPKQARALQSDGPLSLSDQQLELVMVAARTLPVEQRHQFLREVASGLVRSPTDDAVAAAVDLARRAMPPPVFLCDGQTVTNEENKQ
jgi:hypothetical protein